MGISLQLSGESRIGLKRQEWQASITMGRTLGGWGGTIVYILKIQYQWERSAN